MSSEGKGRYVKGKDRVAIVNTGVFSNCRGCFSVVVLILANFSNSAVVAARGM